MYLEQELLKWGGIAGAGGAILGFVASVRKIGRSVKAARERKAKEAQAKIEYEKAVLDRLDAVCEKQTVMTAKQDALGTAQQELAAKLEDVQKDSAYLQMYELKQAYATYMIDRLSVWGLRPPVAGSPECRSGPQRLGRRGGQ